MFPSREALGALGLGLLVVVSYFPAFSGGFIWDDVIFAEEPVIHKASGLWNIWFSPGDIKKEGHYWPLVYTSFWLEHKLWGLAPVLGFVDYGYMQFSFVADRFQYLAGLGVLAVLIGAAAHGANRLPGGLRMAACGVAVVVVGLLGALTWRQAGIYQDEVTFFSHVVALNPAARRAPQSRQRTV